MREVAGDQTDGSGQAERDGDAGQRSEDDQLYRILGESTTQRECGVKETAQEIYGPVTHDVGNGA